MTPDPLSSQRKADQAAADRIASDYARASPRNAFAKRNLALRILADMDRLLERAEVAAAWGESRHRDPGLLAEIRGMRNGRLPRVRELIEQAAP